MDFINTSLFKYLQNHPTYKIDCCNTLLKFVNEDNRFKYVSYGYESIYEADIYIQIVSGTYDEKSIYVNIWKTSNLHFRCYSANSNKIISSKLFKKYPTLPTNIDYGNVYWYHYQQKEIIETLEKLQILNPEYQDKQFQNITLKCVQAIIYIQNVLCNDLINLIIKLLLKLMPHGEDFIWHYQQQKLKN
jgi:hypothetical protein